jgi:hypothetical protein
MFRPSRFKAKYSENTLGKEYLFKANIKGFETLYQLKNSKKLQEI